MNHRILPSIVVAALLLFVSSSMAQPAPAPPATQPAARVSPLDVTNAVIDGNRMLIYHSRPYSKAPNSNEIRKIWGTLVPYGELWRLGANEATLLVTQQPITLGGVDVPAGAYSLFMIPQETGPSILIINKKLALLGNEHDPAQDLGRANMTRSAIPENVPQLTITVSPNATGGGGTLAVRWENTQFAVPLTVKK